MGKNNYLRKNALTVFFMFCLMAGLNAQIFYYDLEPDRNLWNKGIKDIDMNMDGAFDYIIYSDTIGVSIENIVAMVKNDYTGPNNEILCTNVDTLYFVTCLNQNAAINASQNTWYKTTMSSPGIMKVKGVVNLGQWQGQTNKYIGVKVDVGGEKFYGWIRMTINTDGIENTIIYDWAIQQTPGWQIYAGQTSAGTDEQMEDPKCNIFAVNRDIHVSFQRGLSPIGKISVYNMLGDLVFEKKISDKANIINAESFLPGIYIVNVSANGSFYTGKIRL